MKLLISVVILYLCILHSHSEIFNDLTKLEAQIVSANRALLGLIKKLHNRKSCLSDFTFWAGHCYAFIQTPLDAMDAERYCLQQGAHLASVTTGRENLWIGNQILEHGQKEWYLGMEIVELKDVVFYKWLDKAAISYTNWDIFTQKPNFGITKAPGKRCVVLKNVKKSRHPLWYVTDCNKRREFICKMDRFYPTEMKSASTEEATDID